MKSDSDCRKALAWVRHMPMDGENREGEIEKV